MHAIIYSRPLDAPRCRVDGDPVSLMQAGDVAIYCPADAAPDAAIWGEIARDHPGDPGPIFDARSGLAELPQAPRIRRIAPLAFRKRFGLQRAVITVAASQAMEAGDPTLQVFLDDLSASRFVELDSPDTAAGVQKLVDAGLLTAEAATAMLVDGTLAEIEGLAS